MVDTSALGPERSEFLNTKLNPLLHDLVTEIIVSQPQEPLDFMIEWLEKKHGGKSEYKVDERKLKTIVKSEKIKDLEKENAILQEELLRLKNKLQENRQHEKEAVEPSKKTEDDEDEDDDDVLLDEVPVVMKPKAARTSVSAEAYGAWNKKGDFKPPVYPKSDEQSGRLADLLNKSFLFSSCDDNA